MHDIKKIVGLDLTDPYARRPRPVDMAILDTATLEVEFDTLPWNETRQLDLPNHWDQNNTLLVLDGPQAYALARRNTRECERQLGTPAHTHWQPPATGRPFSGYIRGSVSLFETLTKNGWNLPGLDDTKHVNLLEGYPGSAWKKLAGFRLPNKNTHEGRRIRASLLRHCGLIGVSDSSSHDELDAALLAWLGWAFLNSKTMLVGDAVHRDADHALREGQILMPSFATTGWIEGAIGASTTSPNKPSQKFCGTTSIDLPSESVSGIDWVYFATDAGASCEQTLRLAFDHEILVRMLYEDSGRAHPIANVGRVQPGHRILIAHNGIPRAIVEVGSPDEVISGTSALTSLDTLPFRSEIMAAGYDERFKDPCLQAYTGFYVQPVDSSHCLPTSLSQRGQNAIQRASECMLKW